MEAAGCALVGGGVHYGGAEGMVENYTVGAPYVAGGLRAALEVPVGKRFAFVVQGDVIVPIYNLRALQLKNLSDTVRRTDWEAPAVTGAFSAMLLYYFR